MISLHPTRRQIFATASTLSVAMVAVAGTSVATSHREVTLEVDGVSVPVSGFTRTVSDVLDTAGVSVSAHDLVAPALTEDVSTGQTIVVRTANLYNVTVDGSPVEAWSTGTSVSDVLNEVGSGSAVLAADRSAVREALPIIGHSGAVTVVADGNRTGVQAGPQDTVDTLLAKANVEVSPIDRAAFSTASDGTVELQVTRVTRGQRTETASIPFETEQRDDDSLTKGTTSVLQEGQDGSDSATYYEETVDGTPVVSVKVRDSRQDPVSKIIAVGTKEAATTTTASSSSSSSSSSGQGSGTGSAPAGVWASLAQCESGGNAGTNTGNGYYGLYQFSAATWHALGGSGLPSDASAAEQTRIAQKLQASSGWGQWPACASSLGLY